MKHASLNHAYRLVWSDVHNAFVAVVEFARSQGKRGRALTLLCSALLLAGGVQAAPGVNELPTGGQVVAGAATIGTSGNRMEITQSTSRAAIDWNTFNIGSAAQVHFQQPTGGATLNRVLDSNASQIYGKLTSTGQVFLVNPNGVLFAPGAQVDVGGLIASTRNISNTDFMAGYYTFEGNSSGLIINEGNITVGAGGTVALIAAQITNTGHIDAPQGNVLMGAGDKVTLDLGGPLKIVVEQGAVDALIEQGGAIKADGGLVYLTAKAASELSASVINHTGITEASSLTNKGGVIMLEGDRIELADGSRLAATGATGGGEVYVGGGWQGSGPLRQATTVTMARGATVDVSATDLGDGGTAVLWSDVNKTDSWTRAYGTLLAQGGARGGNGGRIETSGHGLDVEGAVVSAAAGSETGTGGLWLLDPSDSVITQAVANTWATALSGGTSVTNEVTGNITTSGTVNMTVMSNDDRSRAATLTLKATGYIALVNASSIGTNSSAAANANPFTINTKGLNKLDMVINPGSAGGAGGFWLPVGSSIKTNGGNITIGGGANAASAAVGVDTPSYEGNALFRGVTINGTLDAAYGLIKGGQIVIKGKGAPSAAAARGVSIAGTVSGGSISIEGTGDGSAAGIALGDGALGAGAITGMRNFSFDGSNNVTLTGTPGTGPAIALNQATSKIHSENNLIVNVTGSLLATGIFDIRGNSTFNMAGYDLNLTNFDNSLGRLFAPNSGNVTVVSRGGINLDTITSTGTIDISTESGSINVLGVVSTSNASSNAVILNAGKGWAPGYEVTGTNSYIKIFPSDPSSNITGGAIRMGSGGRALLYTGSVLFGDGISDLVGSGSGRFRYNSDESVSNFSEPLGNSGVYAIYREQPTITITANSVEKTYDGLAYIGNNGVASLIPWEFKNGDPTSILHGTLAYGGISQGAVEVGSYAITPSGYTNNLGYAIKFVPGTLTIKPVTPTPQPSMPTPSAEQQSTAESQDESQAEIQFQDLSSMPRFCS